MTAQPLTPLPHWHQADADQLLDQIHAAGIVGLGGGAFPAASKLRAVREWQAEQADTPPLVIGNAVACEPGIDADIFILQQEPSDALLGLRVVAHLLNAREVTLALGPRTQSLQESLQKLWQAQADHSSIPLRVHCAPEDAGAGAERQLIAGVRSVPLTTTRSPAAQGVLVQNITTLWAIARAVVFGEVLQRRPVTLGETTDWLAFGTPIAQLQITTQAPLRQGGLWSGESIAADAVVGPETLALHPAPKTIAMPCIRCGQCAPVCPVTLDPEALYRVGQTLPGATPTLAEAQSERGPLQALTSQRLPDCIECGACNAACPSHIDLLAMFRQNNKVLHAATRVAAQAQRASERFARHQERLSQRADNANLRRAERLRARRNWSGQEQNP